MEQWHGCRSWRLTWMIQIHWRRRLVWARRCRRWRSYSLAPARCRNSLKEVADLTWPAMEMEGRGLAVAHDWDDLELAQAWNDVRCQGGWVGCRRWQTQDIGRWAGCRCCREAGIALRLALAIYYWWKDEIFIANKNLLLTGNGLCRRCNSCGWGSRKCGNEISKKC